MVFPPLLAAILNFCGKCKNVFISETEQDRAISTKFFTPAGICRVYYRLFPKIVFPPLLAAILNFCVKCKNAFFDPQGVHRVSCNFWPKIVFPPKLLYLSITGSKIISFCIFMHKFNMAVQNAKTYYLGNSAR